MRTKQRSARILISNGMAGGRFRFAYSSGKGVHGRINTIKQEASPTKISAPNEIIPPAFDYISQSTKSCG